jgi:hypothetical protein
MREECAQLREWLEESSNITDLYSQPTAREHLAKCADCHAAAEDLRATRVLLKEIPPQASRTAPWFALRVMAAIAARERELGRVREAWTVVPRLAARLTWISALVLLLASTWLYESPRSKPVNPGVNDSTAESLFDNPQPPTTKDEVLLSLAAQR